MAARGGGGGGAAGALRAWPSRGGPVAAAPPWCPGVSLAHTRPARHVCRTCVSGPPPPLPPLLDWRRGRNLRGVPRSSLRQPVAPAESLSHTFPPTCLTGECEGRNNRQSPGFPYSLYYYQLPGKLSYINFCALKTLTRFLLELFFTTEAHFCIYTSIPVEIFEPVVTPVKYMEIVLFLTMNLIVRAAVTGRYHPLSISASCSCFILPTTAILESSSDGLLWCPHIT